MEVKDINSNKFAKVVQHMYHTKQVIHLQGGMLDKIKFTEIVANMLEKQWAKLKEDKRESIARYNDSIKKINLVKFEEELETKKKSQESLSIVVTSVSIRQHSIIRWKGT